MSAAATPHGPARARLRVAVLTATDTRTRAEDRSGDLLEEGLRAAGHEVMARALDRDDAETLAGVIGALLDAGAEAVVVTGGTGVAPRDQAPEALGRLGARAIPGFGELFRALSYPEIGAAAMSSRAAAGVVDGRLVFLLPGSPAACRLALEKLLLPELPHLVAQVGGRPRREELAAGEGVPGTRFE
jgi:molybdenum cofactor biosynthesis protein B